jgi:hypothetical protein
MTISKTKKKIEMLYVELQNFSLRSVMNGYEHLGYHGDYEVYEFVICDTV